MTESIRSTHGDPVYYLVAKFTADEVVTLAYSTGISGDGYRTRAHILGNLAKNPALPTEATEVLARRTAVALARAAADPRDSNVPALTEALIDLLANPSISVDAVEFLADEFDIVGVRDFSQARYGRDRIQAAARRKAEALEAAAEALMNS